MRFGDLTFNKARAVDTARYSLLIPDGFQTQGDLTRSFTAWIPDRERPKDPESSVIILTSSVYNTYRKDEMPGITSRSIGKMAQLRALESQNHERDTDKKYRSFTYGAVSGVFNVVSFSGSRNYYPTVFLPSGTQQFHIRINDPLISDAQVVHFMEQWLGTMTVREEWNESLPVNAQYMKSLPLDSDTIALVQQNLARRMEEEYLSFTIDCRLIQEKIEAAGNRVPAKQDPDGKEEAESGPYIDIDAVMEGLRTAREDYAAAIDQVIRESSDYIHAVSAENPDSDFLLPLVETIRDTNAISEVKQTVNGSEYSTPVSLAAKKKELFVTPEIQRMLDVQAEEERKREEVRRKQMDKQRAIIQKNLDELEERKQSLEEQKKALEQELQEKKESVYRGLPDLGLLEEKVESQSGVLSGLMAQKSRLSALQRKKRREADRLIAQSQEDYADLKDRLDQAKKERAAKDREWEAIRNETEAREAEIDGDLEKLAKLTETAMAQMEKLV